MTTTTTTTTVVVVVAGATGTLGSQIVHQLLRRGAEVRALVRSADKGEQLQAAATDREQLRVVVGDLNDEVDVLAGHLVGADVVVSAVQGGPEVIVDGQTALLRAAEAAGVPRMIPSDFSVDLHRLDYGDNLFLDDRKRAGEAFAGSPVRPTSVLGGSFIDVLLSPFMSILDTERDTFSYWGDGEQPMDMTAIADVAAYTAAAALDDTLAGRPLTVAGQVLTMTELHAEIERATGRPLTVQVLGSTADLQQEIERRKATARSPYDFVPLQYQWAMVSGKGKLARLDNDRYPDIAPVTVAGYLAARG